jgi:ATP phosphoribosyltransferase
MEDKRLIIGLPAGSLADPARGGNLIDLLRNAGFPTSGYDRGGPSEFTMTPFLLGWDGRPQEFGAQLGLREIDIAIAGDDWIRERLLELKYEYKQKIKLQKVLSLKRGKIRVVAIVNPPKNFNSFEAWLDKLFQRNPLVTVASEMPYMALDWMRKKITRLGYEKTHGEFSVQKFKTPPRIKNGILIYETWGKTEAKIKNGSCHLGLEITQSGSAIMNYGLQIAETVMESETGVYVNPLLKKDVAKYNLARMFLLNLYGAIFAENKVMITFNSKRDAVDSMIEYLMENKLFANEPTLNHGVNFTEFSIQLDTQSTKLPLARVRYELARLGATGIETIPLESSIPGLDAIEF